MLRNGECLKNIKFIGQFFLYLLSRIQVSSVVQIPGSYSRWQDVPALLSVLKWMDLGSQVIAEMLDLQFYKPSFSVCYESQSPAPQLLRGLETGLQI